MEVESESTENCSVSFKMEYREEIKALLSYIVHSVYVYQLLIIYFCLWNITLLEKFQLNFSSGSSSDEAEEACNQAKAGSCLKPSTNIYYSKKESDIKYTKIKVNVSGNVCKFLICKWLESNSTCPPFQF